MPELILPLIRAGITTLEVTGSITLPKHFDRVEIDATGGDIIITEPIITNVFKNKGSILYVRIDTSTNTVTFQGTGGNSQNEGFQLGNDPQLESIKTYASDDGTWRRDGYGLPEQQAYYSTLSTGLLSIGSASDDPDTNISLNNNLTITSITRQSATVGRYELINNNLVVGQTFIPAGNTPADYDGKFIVTVKIGSNFVEATLLSDPGGDATVVGTYDDSTFNVNLSGKYRIVDRVSETNGAPVNNQFFKVRSRIFNYSSTFNIRHDTFPDGPVIIVLDDTQTVSSLQLANNNTNLPIFSNTEADLNTHVQIGRFIRENDIATPQTIENIFQVNNNVHNINRFITRTLGTINSVEESVVLNAVSGTIQLTRSVGTAFVSSEIGFIPTGGLNPAQESLTATLPELIGVAIRAGGGSVISASTDVNVVDFESSPGVLTTIGTARATNNFFITFQFGSIQLLGQVEYSGASRLSNASTADEAVDNPNLTITGIQTVQISIEQGSSDLDDPAQAIFKELKQFR